MGWFSKKSDPISDRARKLEAEIAALEKKIKTLSEEEAEDAKHQPRIKSTVTRQPHGVRGLEAPAPREPVFEEVDHSRVHHEHEAVDTPQHYNEAGARKFDLVALWRKCVDFFRPPQSSNPKLVSLLAAGNIKGLRPLRREKRIARNRSIFLAVVLLFVLWFLLSMILKQF